MIGNTKEAEGRPGGGKNILAIVLGLAVFAGVLAFCWHMAGNAHKASDVSLPLFSERAADALVFRPAGMPSARLS